MKWIETEQLVDLIRIFKDDAKMCPEYKDVQLDYEVKANLCQETKRCIGLVALRKRPISCSSSGLRGPDRNKR